MEIVRAGVGDAEEIHALQRSAYRSEAAVYGQDIPPMVETLEELRLAFRDHVFLKAVSEGGIVGSVRLRVDDGTDGKCFVGRLVVAPGFQGGGIGTRLMREVEMCFPDAPSFELFTGSRSEGNIRLYRRLGYETCGEETINDSLTLVYLRKPGRASSCTRND